MDRRFAWGVSLIVFSIFIGVIFKFFFLARILGAPFVWQQFLTYMEEPVVAWAVIIYIISWPMLFVGIYLCGHEGWIYAKRFTKYITYKYYHKQAKKHVPRLAKKGVRKTKRFVKSTRKIVHKAGDRAEEFVEKSRKRTKRALKKHGLLKGRPSAETEPEKTVPDAVWHDS